jgi:hypothetical protein
MWMDILEDKCFVFIVSAGRTGTKFFGDQLGHMIGGAFSVHEPDVLMDFKLKSLSQLRLFGWYNLIFGKLTGKTGIRNLSQNYLAGKLSLPELKAAVMDHRERFYRNISQDLIIESYSGWYGAIPAIRSLYKNYKIVIIVRDPRDWVVSNMNWGTMYGKRDWVSRLKLGRLNPAMINDEHYRDQWQNFTRFQKLCWAWNAIYGILLKETADDPNAVIVKFEDLFRSEQKYEHLGKLLAFITRYPGRHFDYRLAEGVLEKIANPNVSYEFPAWKDWDGNMKDDLIRLCSNVAQKFNYCKFPP